MEINKLKAAGQYESPFCEIIDIVAGRKFLVNSVSLSGISSYESDGNDITLN